MKRYILFLLIILGISLTMNAQVKYGPLLGLGYCDNSYGKGLDITLGLFTDFELLDRIGLRPEILYSAKSGTDEADVLGTTTKTKSRVNYIEIPVMVYFQITPHLNMLIGPQFNSPLGGTLEVTPSGGTATESDIDGHGGTGFVAGLEHSAYSRMKIGLRFSQFSYDSLELDPGDGSTSSTKAQVFSVKATMRYTFDW